MNNVLVLTQSHGLSALLILGALGILHAAVKRGFSIHVEVGKKR